MPEIPHISGNKAIKVFESLGFEIVRQKGSHKVTLASAPYFHVRYKNKRKK